MSHRWIPFAILLVLLLAATGCLKRSGGTFAVTDAPIADGEQIQQNNPDSLKTLCQNLQKAIQANDVKKAAALTRSLVPDDERLKKGLKDNVAPATLQTIQAFHQQMMPANDEGFAKLLAAKPTQTVVNVHGATTEEIIQYAPNSVAFKEFPGGTRKLAEQVLRPGMTYYEVEFVEPGTSAGRKFDLFFWDGKQWTMLGPLWRPLKLG